jgi:hypothetical protein
VTVAWILAGVLLAGAPGSGEVRPGSEPETRQEALRQLRERKAQHTTPYRAGRLERGITKIENDRLLEDWLSIGEGGRYYLKFGGITTGAGVAVGPGIRLLRLAEGAVDVNASAVVSLRRYLLAEASVTAQRLGHGRVLAGALGRYQYFPQEDFFGLGPESFRPDRVSFTYKELGVGAFAGLRLAPALSVEARAEYLRPDVGPGKDPLIPSIERVFDDGSAPGLAGQPDFLLTRLTADLNYATPVGNARRGGHYIASISRYGDRDAGDFSFRRFDLDLHQYVPFLQERRVLALRAVASLSDTSGDRRIPFYFQRTLGGSDTLRGFRDYRFRDRHLLLFQAEYRWEVFPALDAAIFYDAGKVAGRARDLNLDHLERDYGFGFRFGTNRGVFLRIDAAFGSPDGPRYFIKFDHVF